MENGSAPPPRVTRATSPTSEATGETASTDSVKLQRNSTQDSPARESISTEWTDEKHSLYLKSMEASFVDELYNSFGSLGWRSRREHSSDPRLLDQKHAHTRSSSGQFKVLQSGCWGNINFGRHAQLDKADQPGVILANPWIRHFRSAHRKKIVASSTRDKAAFGSMAVNVSAKMALTSAALAANSDQFTASHSHLCRYDSVGSNTEVSDQNFIDEDIEGEKASHSCNVKRMKTSVAATSSNDQVVPFGKFPVTTHATKNSFPPETEPPSQQ